MNYKQIMKDRIELFEAIEIINKSTYFVDEIHWHTCLVFGLDSDSVYREILNNAERDYYSDLPYSAEDRVNHIKNEMNEQWVNMLIINND